MEEPELAIALRYDQVEMDAPWVTARGRAVAVEIEPIRRARGIPVGRDADFAEPLAAVEIDRPIPAAVAPLVSCGAWKGEQPWRSRQRRGTSAPKLAPKVTLATEVAR